MVDLLPPITEIYNWGSALRRWLTGFFVNLNVSGNVTDGINNTTVAAITTAVSQAAAAIPASEKGAASGVATLDEGGSVPIAQIPPSVTKNLGYFATPDALISAYPTAIAGNFCIVGSTDTVWVWDTDNEEWVDGGGEGAVISINGQTGAVILNAADVGADAAGAAATVAGNLSTHAGQSTTAHGGIVASADSRLSDARTPTAHTASHKHGGADEIATATASANAIPKAGASGKIGIDWLPTGTDASSICVGNDSRFYSLLSTHQHYYADSMDLPLVADWAVNGLAAIIQDPLNNAIAVREFVSTAETGVGLKLSVPASATNLTIRLFSRAALNIWAANSVIALNEFRIPTTAAGNGYVYECTSRSGDFKTHATTEPNWPTTPGQTVSDDAITWTCRAASAAGISPKLYFREKSGNTAVPAWSNYLLSTAGKAVAGFTNRLYQEDVITVALATVGMTAGKTYQVELTRATSEAADVLTVSWLLDYLRWEFA